MGYTDGGGIKRGIQSWEWNRLKGIHTVENVGNVAVEPGDTPLATCWVKGDTQ